MSHVPFPGNVSRVFSQNDIERIDRDTSGNPTAVCVTVRDAGDLAVALKLLADAPESFALFEKKRYLPSGGIQPCDPRRPSGLAELRAMYEVELVRREWPGPRWWVHLFTSTEQEWENAKEAMRHLLRTGYLSLRSYLEGGHGEELQGLSARHLDAAPDLGWVVESIRESAIRAQSGVEPTSVDGPIYALRILVEE